MVLIGSPSVLSLPLGLAIHKDENFVILIDRRGVKIAPQKLPAFFQGLDKKASQTTVTCRFRIFLQVRYSSFIISVFGVFVMSTAEQEVVQVISNEIHCYIVGGAGYIILGDFRLKKLRQTFTTKRIHH